MDDHCLGQIMLLHAHAASIAALSEKDGIHFLGGKTMNNAK